MNAPDRNAEATETTIVVPDQGTVNGILIRPRAAAAALVLAHGAGAGMRHAFMEAVARAMARHRIATLRYQFPYMQAGRKRPDAASVAQATVRAAIEAGRRELPGLPLFAGGKSFGGRMTSQAAASSRLPGVRGLIFLGFPLHPGGKPGSQRAEHLSEVGVPMLFLQGTRDRLADLTLLRPELERLGGGATLHVLEGADHSFHVLKRSGRTDPEVLEELAAATAGWVSSRAAAG